jgi:cell division protein FtsZ
MAEDLMNFDLPQNKSSIIKVLGIGGGGNNAVNHMYRLGIREVDFIVCNTDAQALHNSPVPVKVQIGESLTEGRGAGNKPEVGRQAAIENLGDVMRSLGSNTKMVFLTAGMGGGTGTGAAPVIAKATREAGILTVAIVTMPFRFEGPKRYEQAVEGIRQLREYVDSLLVINNEKLREIYGDLKLSQAFARADDVLTRAAKGIAEIITVHGYINVDFADVQTVMANSGVAIMGSGSASSEGRAVKAIQEALTSPLLNNNDITGAKNILLNITSGTEEVSMDEVGEITDYVNSNIDKNATIIWGTCYDPSLEDKVNITIIATGFEADTIPELYKVKSSRTTYQLEEKKTHTPGEQKVFEIKDKTEPSNIIEPDPPKRVVEFELFPDHHEPVHHKHEKVEEPDSEKYADRINKLKRSQQFFRENQGIPDLNFRDNIDELENEPAYVRKQIKLERDESSAKSKVSRFSLTEDENKTVELKTDNSYLHDNVD